MRVSELWAWLWDANLSKLHGKVSPIVTTKCRFVKRREKELQSFLQSFLYIKVPLIMPTYLSVHTLMHFKLHAIKFIPMVIWYVHDLNVPRPYYFPFFMVKLTCVWMVLHFLSGNEFNSLICTCHAFTMLTLKLANTLWLPTRQSGMPFQRRATFRFYALVKVTTKGEVHPRQLWKGNLCMHRMGPQHNNLGVWLTVFHQSHSTTLRHGHDQLINSSKGNFHVSY